MGSFTFAFSALLLVCGAAAVDDDGGNAAAAAANDEPPPPSDEDYPPPPDSRMDIAELNRCGDTDQGCPHWTSYCGKHSYVDQHCRKTCGQCGGGGGGCSDTDGGCPHWTSYCGKHSYVDQHCRKTCGKCGGGGGGCSDQDSGCPHWTSHCGKHSYVDQKCKKTCGTCGGGGGGSGVRVMTYNLFGWTALVDGGKAQQLYNVIKSASPDILGAQEVEGRQNQVWSALSGYDMIGGGTRASGCAIFWKRSKFHKVNGGRHNLPEADKHGQRVIDWVQLNDRSTGQKVDFFNTHWCVCSDSRLRNTANAVMQVVNSRKRSGSMVVLVGDFNMRSSSQSIGIIKSQLKDVGGGGSIDFIFTNQGTRVSRAWSPGRGSSDHPSIAADLK